MRSPTSDDDDDDSYGSKAQVETEETKMGNELSHKYHGPERSGMTGRRRATRNGDGKLRHTLMLWGLRVCDEGGTGVC